MTTDTQGKRFRVAERRQVELLPASIDELLPPDHRARLLWECIEKMSLDELYKDIKATAATVGRTPIDPRILLTLWVVATSEKIGSARHLADRCERDIVYRWICGGVSVNHHTLSDFRSKRGEQIDELLTQTIGALLHIGAITLRVVAQDGTKVRVAAGSSSFHRQETLEECLEVARKHLEEVKAQSQQESDERTAAEKGAQESLGGHFKSGHWRSLQNRPTNLGRDWFTPPFPLQSLSESTSSASFLARI